MTRKDFVLKHWKGVLVNLPTLRTMDLKVQNIARFLEESRNWQRPLSDDDFSYLTTILSNRIRALENDLAPITALPRFLLHDFGECSIHKIIGGIERVGRLLPDGTTQQVFRNTATGEEVSL